MSATVVNSSVLSTIRHMLGMENDYTHFDADLVVNINTALSILYQLGLNDHPVSITGEDDTWSDILGSREDLEFVKSWIYLKVKLMFDPPMNSFLVEAYEKKLAELEWRINIQCETESN